MPLVFPPHFMFNMFVYGWNCLVHGRMIHTDKFKSLFEQTMPTFVNNYFYSKYGWDHVIQGLVHLGFLLMDSFGPKAVFGRIDTSTVPQTGPTHLACQLGSKVLLNTFKVGRELKDYIRNYYIWE